MPASRGSGSLVQVKTKKHRLRLFLYPRGSWRDPVLLLLLVPCWQSSSGGAELHEHDPYTYCPKCAARLELKTQMGEERLTCPQCGWVYYQDPKVACAALLLQGQQVLLVQRTMEPYIGLWSLPAGFVNAFELPEAAVVREAREETGLDVTVLHFFMLLSGREHPRGSDILLVYQVKQVGGVLAAGDDAGAAAWFKLDALPPLAFASTHKILAQAVST